MAPSRKRMKLWVTKVPDVPDHTPESPRKAHSESGSPRSTDDDTDIEQESDHRSTKRWPAEQTEPETPLKELSEDGFLPDGYHATTPPIVEQFESASPIRTGRISVGNENSSDYPPSVSWESEDSEPLSPLQDSESGDDSDNPSIMSWEGEETASESGSRTGESWENYDDPEEWQTQLVSLLMFFQNSMGTDIIQCYGMVNA
jgi:hypothetical protein